MSFTDKFFNEVIDVANQIDKNKIDTGEFDLRCIVGGVLIQKRDLVGWEPKLLTVPTKTKPTDEQLADLRVAWLAAKHTKSNAIVLAKGRKIIGIGAGQQSRVHCTRLAGSKADLWWLRQHPRILEAKFKDGASRAEKNNAIDQYLLEHPTPFEKKVSKQAFATAPKPLSSKERREWLAQLDGVSLSSDAFFPFRDSLDRAAQSGVRYVLQPGGSDRDDAVIQACEQHGMVMAMSGLRLFHH